MEQGALATPNLSSFARLSGHAHILVSGETSYRSAGNIVMTKLGYNPEKISLDIAVDGDSVQVVEETSRTKPVFDISGNQFHSAILDLVLLGTKNADVVQASGTASTTTITAELGRGFDIGARNITVTTVKVGATTFTDGTDFFMEANKGWIRFPEVAGGIAAGDIVVVTFNKLALTRESITALNKLNRLATIKLFHMDNKSPIPRFEWNIPGTLTADDAGDFGDVKKFADWKMKFALGTAAANVLARKL